jgi:hypothetical protein
LLPAAIADTGPQPHPRFTDAIRSRREPSTARTELFIARSIHMLDIAMLAIAIAFFTLSVGYTIACDRL